MRSFVVGVAILASLLPGGPARATTEDPVVDAIVALQAEIMLLAELDAFETPIPRELIAVREEWDEYLEGLDRIELLDWLIESDSDGEVALRSLVASGIEPSTETRNALEALSDDVVDGISAGMVGITDPAPYVAALGHLELFDGAADRSSSGEPASTTTAAPPAPTAGGAPFRSNPVEPPYLVAGALAIAVIGLVIRRRGDRDPAFSDRLLEAGRRMTRAFDLDEVARIATVEAVALAGADHGAYIHVRDDAMEVMPGADPIFEARSVDEGVLRRVADTGQAVNTVTHDEPFVTALPAAFLAMPIIGAGRVNGILTLIRSDARPFTPAEQAIVAELAPMIGSASAACRRHDDLAELSMTDPLTGLPNRRRLDADLGATGDRRRGGLVAVAMVDVDHFKLFNDTHGHSAGDDALRAVADALAAAVRSGDGCYRYGGEEFTLILHVDSDAGATEIAERARRAVEHATVRGAETQPGGTLSVSIGLAIADATTAQAALATADAALYTAKTTGRNRVHLAERSSSPAIVESLEGDRRPA